MNINAFADKCIEYNKKNNIDIKSFKICPVHVYAAQRNVACKDTHSGIMDCKLCEQPICPICGNHNVTQVSRVTGYMSSVIGWNIAKRQELKDRQRYNIGR